MTWSPKSVISLGAHLCSNPGGSYFSWLEMLLNVLFSCVPRVFTTAIIATEMPAAMRPYSMAVAPVLSFTKRRTSFLMGNPSEIFGLHAPQRCGVSDPGNRTGRPALPRIPKCLRFVKRNGIKVAGIGRHIIWSMRISR